MAIVIIKKIRAGKRKGQFRFILKADNGENLSPNESYTRLHNVKKTLSRYFPDFKIIDETK